MERLLAGEIPHPDWEDYRGLKLLGLSQEEQSRFLDRERKLDQSDILEYQDKGTLLKDFLGPLSSASEAHGLLVEFDLQKLQDQGMRFLSTGERRKAFILRLINAEPDVILLENPLAGLDQATAIELKQWLNALSIPLLLILSRFEDLPTGCTRLYRLADSKVSGPYTPEDFPPLNDRPPFTWQSPLPPPPKEQEIFPPRSILFRMEGVNLSYYGKPVLEDIHWEVRKGEFWQLTGPNGSGKSTLISLINGENPRAFGQNIELFGRPRGSGETLWDIRRRIGDLSPVLQQDFRLPLTVGEVLISGFFDSIGVYDRVKGYQRYLAEQWLERSSLNSVMDHPFKELSQGEQRLVLLMRALIKHPPLLLLDEPLLALDEEAAHSLAELVNLAAEESESTLIFVSHRPEKALKATHTLQLVPGERGFRGKIL